MKIVYEKFAVKNLINEEPKTFLLEFGETSKRRRQFQVNSSTSCVLTACCHALGFSLFGEFSTFAFEETAPVGDTKWRRVEA